VRLSWHAPVRRDRNQLPLAEVAPAVAGSRHHNVKRTDLLPAEGAPAHGVGHHWAVHRKLVADAHTPQVAEPADGGVQRRGPPEVVHRTESCVGHKQEELHHKQEDTW